jgi:hypothetical protein
LPAILSIVSGRAQAAETEDPERYSIAQIRAHSYYPERGEFDERDLLDPTLVLWNVIGGAGDARDPTEITLVLVTIEGPSFVSGTKGAVELQANASGASPPRQSIPFHSLFSEQNRMTVPFLVHGTGCAALELEARITGVPGDPPSKKAKIPFTCGE